MVLQALNPNVRFWSEPLVAKNASEQSREHAIIAQRLKEAVCDSARWSESDADVFNALVLWRIQVQASSDYKTLTTLTNLAGALLCLKVQDARAQSIIRLAGNTVRGTETQGTEGWHEGRRFRAGATAASTILAFKRDASPGLFSFIWKASGFAAGDTAFNSWFMQRGLDSEQLVAKNAAEQCDFFAGGALFLRTGFVLVEKESCFGSSFDFVTITMDEHKLPTFIGNLEAKYHKHQPEETKSIVAPSRQPGLNPGNGKYCWCKRDDEMPDDEWWLCDNDRCPNESIHKQCFDEYVADLAKEGKVYPAKPNSSEQQKWLCPDCVCFNMASLRTAWQAQHRQQVQTLMASVTGGFSFFDMHSNSWDENGGSGTTFRSCFTALDVEKDKPMREQQGVLVKEMADLAFLWRWVDNLESQDFWLRSILTYAARNGKTAEDTAALATDSLGQAPDPSSSASHEKIFTAEMISKKTQEMFATAKTHTHCAWLQTSDLDKAAANNENLEGYNKKLRVGEKRWVFIKSNEEWVNNETLPKRDDKKQKPTKTQLRLDKLSPQDLALYKEYEEQFLTLGAKANAAKEDGSLPGILECWKTLPDALAITLSLEKVYSKKTFDAQEAQNARDEFFDPACAALEAAKQSNSQCLDALDFTMNAGQIIDHAIAIVSGEDACTDNNAPDNPTMAVLRFAIRGPRALLWLAILTSEHGDSFHIGDMNAPPLKLTKETGTGITYGIYASMSQKTPKEANSRLETHATFYKSAPGLSRDVFLAAQDQVEALEKSGTGEVQFAYGGKCGGRFVGKERECPADDMEVDEGDDAVVSEEDVYDMWARESKHLSGVDMLADKVFKGEQVTHVLMLLDQDAAGSKGVAEKHLAECEGVLLAMLRFAGRKEGSTRVILNVDGAFDTFRTRAYRMMRVLQEQLLDLGEERKENVRDQVRAGFVLSQRRLIWVACWVSRPPPSSGLLWRFG